MQLWCDTRPKLGSGPIIGKMKKPEGEPQRELSPWRCAIDASYTENVNVRRCIICLEGGRMSMGPRASSWRSGPLDLQIWMDHIRNQQNYSKQDGLWQ